MTVPSDPYWKLRERAATLVDEICSCAEQPPVVLQCHLSANPLSYLSCNLEVPPERLSLPPKLAEDIASWRDFHDASSRSGWTPASSRVGRSRNSRSQAVSRTSAACYSWRGSMKFARHTTGGFKMAAPRLSYREQRALSAIPNLNHSLVVFSARSVGNVASPSRAERCLTPHSSALQLTSSSLTLRSRS